MSRDIMVGEWLVLCEVIKTPLKILLPSLNEMEK